MKRNWRIIVFICALTGLWIFMAPGLRADLSGEEKQDLFSKAKETFRNANEAAADDPRQAEDLYRQSVMRFERLVREGGIQNGKLYYNIGNGYFRMKDLGRAILNYRKAKRYITGDPNLAQNLAYARSRCRDRIEIQARAQILKTVLFWHYDLSPHIRSIIFVSFFMIFWTGAAVRLFRKGAVPRWILVLAGIIALLFLGSVIAGSVHQYRNIPGVILADEVTARKGDGDNFEPAFKNPLHEGTEFTLVEKRNEWYQVELNDSRRCWVPKNSAGLVRE